MKKILNNISRFFREFIFEWKEILTAEFISEIIKKPSFIAWTALSILAFILALIYIGILKTIEILIIGLVFYFVFLRKNN